MERFVSVIILLFGINQVGVSQAGVATAQTSKQFEEKVDKLFAQWDKPDLPGCALGVIKDGRIIYEHGYGMADLEHNVPISPRTTFDIGSISKQFTALAIMLLVQQGKVSLDNDVRKYLPEMPDYRETITVRQLLYHTSGLRNHFLLKQLSGWRWGDLETRGDSLATVARQRELNFRPGEEHSYSNTGYFLLGEIVNRVSGPSLREFAERNIFNPLGMKDTQIHDDVSLVIRSRAWGYNSVKNGGWVNNITRSEEVGDANVYTSVEDLARWDQNFYDQKVGGDAVMAEMLREGTLNNGRKIGYAAGLRLGVYKGLRIVRHGGWSTSRAEYLRFPDQHFSVVCLCNTGAIDPETLAQQVADIFLIDLLKPAPVEGPPSAETQAKAIAEIRAFIGAHTVKVPDDMLSKLAGFYVNTDNGNRRRLLMKAGKLMVERRPGLESELVPIGDNRFLMADVPVKLEVSFRELWPEFRVMLISSGENTTPLALVYAGPESDHSRPTTDYVGSFRSDEADATVSLVIQDGRLILRTPRSEAPKTPGDEASGRSWFPLEPLCDDSFKNGWIGLLKFTGDAKKQINGFFISNYAGGVRHLQFRKVNGAR